MWRFVLKGGAVLLIAGFVLDIFWRCDSKIFNRAVRRAEAFFVSDCYVFFSYTNLIRFESKKLLVVWLGYLACDFAMEA